MKKIEEEEKKKAEEEQKPNNENKQNGIDLSNIVEGNLNINPENEGTRHLLKAFSSLNIKSHLLTDDLDKIFSK